MHQLSADFLAAGHHKTTLWCFSQQYFCPLKHIFLDEFKNPRDFDLSIRKMSSVENGCIHFTEDVVKLSIAYIIKTIGFWGHSIECLQTIHIYSPNTDPHLHCIVFFTGS